MMCDVLLLLVWMLLLMMVLLIFLLVRFAVKLCDWSYQNFLKYSLPCN